LEWSTHDDAAAAFERGLGSSFLRAADGRTIVRNLRFGARCIALHFASESLLAQLSPAFARLEPDDVSTPELTIRVWDGDSSRVALPRSPWLPQDIGPRGDISGFGSPRFRAAFNLEAQTLCFADSEVRRSHFWVSSAPELPEYERAAPLRTLLAWGVEAWGLQLAHAGCVARDGRAVLLVGRGGSGKSTCALSCLGAGLEYLADDYCVLSLASGRPEAYGLYATGKLEPEHLHARFPELRARAVRGGGRKATLFVHGASLRRSAEPVAVEALVLPQVASDGATRLERCSAAAALSALAPSSIFQISGLGALAFRFLADFARRVPCYRLTLGAELSQVRRALVELVA
jgi:hypothetical protein